MTLTSLNQYGTHFQIKVISSLLTHKEFLTNIHDIISEEYWDNQAHQWIIKEIIRYYDKVKGVKGLGEKKLYKLFPELSEKDMSLDDIYNICEGKFKENVIYARIIENIYDLEKNYKIMDLSNPMLDENDKKYLSEIVKSKDYHYIPDQFIAFYNEDKLGGMIRNVEFWVKDVFEKLKL